MSEPPPEVPETLATYLRLRGLEPSKYAKRRRRRRPAEGDENLPFTPGRDPKPVGDALDALSKQHGWSGQLAREDLVRRWEEVAGAETAQHSTPTSLVDGTLTIQCDSTAWAKNLQFMRSHILTQITTRFPDAAVEHVRFVGPDAPTWKWGPRTVPGRGPRDTYG
jgi:predicted nucleic acid-binding Zn ribbon protein